MTNYEQDDIFEPDEMPEAFEIHDHDKADEAIRKIKEERERRDIFVSVIDRQIEELKLKRAGAEQKCEARTIGLLAALNAYLDNVPAKETKTQKAFDLPSGRIIRKFAAPTYDYDEAELMEYLHRDAPEYIKITEKAAWGELRKDLQIVGDAVIRKSTGALVDEIRVTEIPEKAEVK